MIDRKIDRQIILCTFVFERKKERRRNIYLCFKSDQYREKIKKDCDR